MARQPTGQQTRENGLGTIGLGVTWESTWQPSGEHMTKRGKARRWDSGVPSVRNKWHVRGIQREVESECVVRTLCGCLRLQDFSKWHQLDKHRSSEFQNHSPFWTKQILKKHHADLSHSNLCFPCSPNTLIPCLILSCEPEAALQSPRQ